MTLTPEDAKLLSEVRGWGDRATNGERRLVAMVDALAAKLADVQRESVNAKYWEGIRAENVRLAARLASAEAMLRAVLKWFTSDMERQYVTGAMIQARVETTLNAAHPETAPRMVTRDGEA